MKSLGGAMPAWIYECAGKPMGKIEAHLRRTSCSSSQLPAYATHSQLMILAHTLLMINYYFYTYSV